MEQQGAIRFTEQAHPKTHDIDLAAPSEIVNLLRECDLDIFDGWNGSQGVFNKAVVETLDSVAKVSADIIQRKSVGDKTGIVIAGCGTSGRMAFIVARYFNIQLSKRGMSSAFNYLIAGNDAALFISQELAEDDPHLGRRDLVELTTNMDHVLYIGITCGLSAAYVAGQLDHCMDNLHKFTPVLMGFNPVHLAKDLPSEVWDKTFKTVATRLDMLMVQKKGFIINPLIGPEPITGSTRMKSGTTTKILLEVIFTMALMKTFHASDICDFSRLLKSYRMVQAATYSDPKSLGRVIELGGRSLNTDHHICYTASNSLGIIGMVDASECPPTCGSADDDVRGFVKGGFQFLGNREGTLPEHEAHISLDSFTKNIMPVLSKEDLIMVLSTGEEVVDKRHLEETKAAKVLVHFRSLEAGLEGSNDSLTGKWTHQITISLPWAELSEMLPRPALDMCMNLFQEISCKWVCNMLSTGAHILHGKFFNNLMLDVQIRNDKLYYRAITIVQAIAKCLTEDAKTALLRSIYQTDELTEAHFQNVVSTHVKFASAGTRVVPVAVLLLTNKCDVATARHVLGQHKIVRAALEMKS